MPYTGTVYFVGTDVTKPVAGTYIGVEYYYMTTKVEDVTGQTGLWMLYILIANLSNIYFYV